MIMIAPQKFNLVEEYLASLDSSGRPFYESKDPQVRVIDLISCRIFFFLSLRKAAIDGRFSLGVLVSIKRNSQGGKL